MLKEFKLKFEEIDKSFILVSSKREWKKWDDLVISTFQEAKDCLEMEEVQRQLKY